MASKGREEYCITCRVFGIHFFHGPWTVNMNFFTISAFLRLYIDFDLHLPYTTHNNAMEQNIIILARIMQN